ncbi:divalent-cation tolerance protein CutA [Shewanella zhangzhouensis]|uniref:divalent-cation tolerance protein CutA n=1 Tax=Shewanella zhangzhouensis TaxID=2864213 RepID=UPI001C655C9A|nr:divalent-cation tolerance protein CutA [Shewanella zhangzhouensis]QYK05804.1 divalent-cation tolerance protein CutA [Shewanella zhangzhouensis]
MAQSMDDYILVMTTCPSEDVGLAIAKRLVSNSLAACVQQGGPVTSVYHWQGKLCEDREYPLFIKTRRALYAEVERVISELHPYELPEIIATPVTEALPGYLNWINDNTQS